MILIKNAEVKESNDPRKSFERLRDPKCHKPSKEFDDDSDMPDNNSHKEPSWNT